MKINSDPANLDSAKFDDTPTKNTGVDVDDTVLSCAVCSGTTARPVVFLHRGTSCFRQIEREVALIYFIFFQAARCRWPPACGACHSCCTSAFTLWQIYGATLTSLSENIQQNERRKKKKEEEEELGAEGLSAGETERRTRESVCV